MSRRTIRSLAVGEIAISDAAALHLRVLGQRGLTTQLIRHVQREWAVLRQRPGHYTWGRLEVGDLVLSFLLSRKGTTRAVIVTPVECAVMRMQAINPRAPGKISPLRPASIEEEPAPMKTLDLSQHVRKHILGVAGDLLDDAELVVALPKKLTKKTRGNSYEAERWFWNLRGEEPFALLIALASKPETAGDIVIAEAFRVPRKELGDRKVLARYKTAKVNRVGSFLDRFAVKIPASKSAPASLEASPPPQ